MDTKDYQPVLAVKVIKRILLEEQPNFAYFGTIIDSDRIRYYLREEKEVIENCETYQDLDNYIHQSRRMSLEDWVNSL
jgi:selenophosphate synthetase-related protein